MKTIHLIRHAKSSWDDPDLADVLRPLNKRGIKACRLMAPALINAGCDLTHVFCSPAVRTQSTMTLIAQALPSADLRWTVEKTLYTFDYRQLLAWLNKLNNDYDSVTIVGHNPALTDLINYLSNESLQNLPTAAYAQLIAESISDWQSIEQSSFVLGCLITPKTVTSTT